MSRWFFGVNSDNALTLHFPSDELQNYALQEVVAELGLSEKFSEDLSYHKLLGELMSAGYGVASRALMDFQGYAAVVHSDGVISLHQVAGDTQQEALRQVELNLGLELPEVDLHRQITRLEELGFDVNMEPVPA